MSTPTNGARAADAIRRFDDDGVLVVRHPALRSALVASFMYYGEMLWAIQDRRALGPPQNLHYKAMAGRLMAHVRR